jgi:8-oxo-dGTP pyrophosphatase MutT (NUDIX family)
MSCSGIESGAFNARAALGIPQPLWEIHFSAMDASTAPVSAVDSSTVLVLRDTAVGVEVLMLERHLDSDFVGGAFVFPGGKVDQADVLDVELWSGIDPNLEAGRMSVTPEIALALYVAAVRETFEEGGLLYARKKGRPVTESDLDSGTFKSARARLNSRTESWDWSQWLRAENLVLDLGALTWWSWWVTPEGVHRRYDTRFFVALAPTDQTAAHDEVETVHSVWTTPGRALAAAADGTAMVILPTRKNLEQLQEHRTARAAWEWAADRIPPRIGPEIVRDGGRVVVRHETFGSIEEL